jgi:hypothetical protein
MLGSVSHERASARESKHVQLELAPCRAETTYHRSCMPGYYTHLANLLTVMFCLI